MAKKVVTIKVVLSGPKDVLDESGFDLVDRVLDEGVLQDAINDAFKFEGVKARVCSCIIGGSPRRS